MKMNIRTLFGLAAVGGFLAIAAPGDRAQAASLINPVVSSSVKHVPENITTEVRWRHHRGWHRHYGWRRHHHWRRHYGWHPHRYRHRRHHWY